MTRTDHFVKTPDEYRPPNNDYITINITPILQLAIRGRGYSASLDDAAAGCAYIGCRRLAA